MKTSVSTFGAFSLLGIDEGLKAIADAGFDAIDLGLDSLFPPKDTIDEAYAAYLLDEKRIRDMIDTLKEGLKKYGISVPNVSASKFLFYIPLAVLVSCNLWFGVTLNYSVTETVLYIVSMFGVGFLEEFLFRGLLFKAMEKNGLRSAVIVSSITFGIGHIINLFNGSGADLVSNLCQIFSAVAFGFLFVIIFFRSKSLLPCIFAHIAINSLNVFAKEITPQTNIIVSVILTVIAIAYTLILHKTLPKTTE